MSTQNISFHYEKKAPLIIPNLQLRDFSKGLKNGFVTVVVNDPSVFKPLKVYCAKINHIHKRLQRTWKQLVQEFFHSKSILWFIIFNINRALAQK